MAIFHRLINAWRKMTWPGDEYARWKGVKVGSNCRILIRSFGSEPFLIEIGDDVTVSSGVQLITHDGATWLVRDEVGRRFHYAPIKIGNSVFVGAGAVIMPGVEIGNNVIIGAGSVVTKSVPDGVIAAGNPACIIGTFDRFWDHHIAYSVSQADLQKIPGGYKAKIEGVVYKTPKPLMQSRA